MNIYSIFYYTLISKKNDLKSILKDIGIITIYTFTGNNQNSFKPKQLRLPKNNGFATKKA